MQIGNVNVVGSVMIIALQTVDESFFFDNQSPFDGTVTEPPSYIAPTTFPLSRGAQSIVAARTPDVPTDQGPQNGILVSYPDTDEIRYVTVE